MLKIKDLRSLTFDMNTLDAELTCMAMTRSLGPDYSNFMSLLALLTDLDKDKVKAAFQTEKINRRPRSDALPIPTTDSALSTLSSGAIAPKMHLVNSVTSLGTANASTTHSNEPRSTTRRTRARTGRGRKHRQLLPLPQTLRTSLNALAMQVFVPLPLTLSHHLYLMLTMIGMQTWVPLLI